MTDRNHFVAGGLAWLTSIAVLAVLVHVLADSWAFALYELGVLNENNTVAFFLLMALSGLFAVQAIRLLGRPEHTATILFAVSALTLLPAQVLSALNGEEIGVLESPFGLLFFGGPGIAVGAVVFVAVRRWSWGWFALFTSVGALVSLIAFGASYVDNAERPLPIPVTVGVFALAAAPWLVRRRPVALILCCAVLLLIALPFVVVTAASCDDDDCVPAPLSLGLAGYAACAGALASAHTTRPGPRGEAAQPSPPAELQGFG